MHLNFDDIPEDIQVKKQSYKLVKHEVIVGCVLGVTSTLQMTTLHQSLTDGFQKSSSLLIIIGAVVSCVEHRMGKFYFFNSHSHDDFGLVNLAIDGVSILIGYRNIDDLISYLYAFYQSMFIDLQTCI